MTKFTEREVRAEIAGMQCAIDNAGFGHERLPVHAYFTCDSNRCASGGVCTMGTEMTDTPDTLRPEVRAAINRQDRQEKCDEYCPVCEDRAIIRAELLRLATIEADALIALDCEHDWQVEHRRAERAEAELVALKARIAESPVATLVLASSAGDLMLIWAENPDEWVDKDVRLLVDEPPAKENENG